MQKVKLDVIQLHGDEDNEYIEYLRELNIPIWQAIKVKSSQDILLAKQSRADMILFDTYNQNYIGGTGKNFNWNLIERFESNFVLAGGLNVQNIIRAIRIAKPYIVDVSSGVENLQGKDEAKLKEFIKLVRRAG